MVFVRSVLLFSFRAAEQLSVQCHASRLRVVRKGASTIFGMSKSISIFGRVILEKIVYTLLAGYIPTHPGIILSKYTSTADFQVRRTSRWITFYTGTR